MIHLISNHPWVALGVAVLAGMIIGAIVGLIAASVALASSRKMPVQSDIEPHDLED